LVKRVKSDEARSSLAY